MKRYFSIDVAALNSSNLSYSEWCILENIHFLSYEGWCFAKRENLADHHKMSIQNYKKILTKLVDNDWIIRDKKHNIKTSKKWHDLSSLNPEKQGYQKVDGRGIKSESLGVSKSRRLSYKERTEERGGEETASSFNFKAYMDVLDYLQENDWKNKFIEVPFEDIIVLVSKYGKAYNKTNLQDLPRNQETRFLKYLMNNTKYLEMAKGTK